MKQISSHYGDTEVFMVIGNTAIMTCKMHEHKEKKMFKVHALNSYLFKSTTVFGNCCYCSLTENVHDIDTISPLS